MAILGDKPDIFRNTPSTSLIIANVERRKAAKKQALEDLQYEYDLIEQDAFSLYKNNITYLTLFPDSIRKAQKWMIMLEEGVDADGNKLDKRRKYDEKNSFEFFTDRLRMYLNDDLVITKIINFNYGEAWEVEFTLQNNKWRIRIPIINNISLRSYQHYGHDCFKLKLWMLDEYDTLHWVGSTFDENELKDMINKGD